MIERDFDIPFIADLALREKQIQQNYRPLIAIHKWFARRPGTLFRGLLLAEFAEAPLRESFYQANDLSGLRVADPFMGGGTPLIEANRVGCDVLGCDINPMSYWIVRQSIEDLDLDAYRKEAARLQQDLRVKIGSLYQTRCEHCGCEAPVKYYIWVKTQRCEACGHSFDLSPGYTLADKQRHPAHVIICSHCGELNEVSDPKHAGSCGTCGALLRLKGRALRNRAECPECGHVNSYPQAQAGKPQHCLVAIEYYCPACKSSHKGRFFKKPDPTDLAKYDTATKELREMNPSFIPEDEIPPGDETDRLLRWGYSYYRDMFNDRQLLGLEWSCRAIAEIQDESLRHALATNLSDLLRYQNMLCRYDTSALKSLDIFSVHGFPVGLVQCESNLLGIISDGGMNVGSGGWANIVEKYAKAKAYCSSPFEMRYRQGRKTQIDIHGEWIGECSPHTHRTRIVDLRCESSTELAIAPGTLDAVLTDPPYYANVQYAELMDFCYVWLRKILSAEGWAFDKRSTRDPNELTGNSTLDRGLDHFTEGLARVFSNMAKALKSGAPLAFTYHHNQLEAYLPLIVAILDARLTCSASIPCPAEMGASIHINGTGSSIMDTVFVCRSTGKVARRFIVDSPRDIAELVRMDLDQLQYANIKVSLGDIRCIAHGHLTRLAIWNLRKVWSTDRPVEEKLKLALTEINRLGGWLGVKQYLADDIGNIPQVQQWKVQEEQIGYGGMVDEVSF